MIKLYVYPFGFMIICFILAVTIINLREPTCDCEKLEALLLENEKITNENKELRIRNKIYIEDKIILVNALKGIFDSPQYKHMIDKTLERRGENEN